MAAGGVVLSEKPSTAAPSTGPRRAAVVFVFVTVLIDVLAMGLIIPVLPALVLDFIGGDAAHAARWYGLFAAVWALMQFFASPFLGALSDRFGRRPVILLSCLGLGLDYVFMALAPSLPWLLVGRIISGVTAAGFSTAMAYISDVTPPEKRAASFGMLGAAFGGGFVLGPAVGGLLGGLSPRAPFWVAGAMALVNVLYGYFVLPESLDAQHRRAFDWKRANPLGALLTLRRRPGLPGLMAIYTLYVFAHTALQSTFVLYTQSRYGWDSRAVGLLLAAIGVGGMVVQGGLVRLSVARFGERRTLLLGVGGAMIGFAAFGLAPTGPLLMASVPLISLMFFTGPSMQGLMARRVAPNEYGLLQGSNASLMGMCGIVGPLTFTQVFAWFVVPRGGVTLPGAPFLVAASLFILAWFLAWHHAHPPAAASSTDAAPPPNPPAIDDGPATA